MSESKETVVNELEELKRKLRDLQIENDKLAQYSNDLLELLADVAKEACLPRRLEVAISAIID